MKVDGGVESKQIEERFLMVPEPDGGGFSCRLIFCADPECDCRSVGVCAIRFGPDVGEALGLDQEQNLVAKPGHGPIQLNEVETYQLIIDIDEGDLVWDTGEDEEEEKEDVLANPSLARLQKAFDGSMLEKMGRQWLTVKGLEITERCSQSDLGNWNLDRLVCWREVFTEFRLDAYVIDEKGYLAYDYYCIDPGCDCDEVSVDFDDVMVDPEKSILGTVNVMLATGRVTLKAEPGWDEKLLEELWNRFIDRHHSIDYLRQRQAKMKEFGSELAAQLQSPKPVGRNQPCPCGSGKKYKKCCLGKGT